MNCSKMSSDIQSLPSGLKEVIVESTGLQVRIYYLECLAHASYVVTHEKRAFVVDPRRDVDAYVEELNNLGATLVGVLETHFHADFVSGHLELQKRFNVPIYFGPGSGSRAQFALQEVQDGEEIPLSSQYCFKVCHTPGHTPESVCYILTDKKANNPKKVFTGDTLFIGSCGRPDLVGSLGYTAADMAEQMYASLRNKLMTLPLDVQVFPAHGAGSPCGKNLGTALYSTIGQEIATNPALQFTEKNEFVKFLTEDPQTTPHYFTYNVDSNIKGAPPLKDDVLQVPKVGPVDFMKHYTKHSDFVVLDTRNAVEFANSFIPKSINCPIGSEGGVIVGPEDGNFSIWVGTMIHQSQKIGLIAPPGREMETLQRLGRIGYSNVLCVLDGGIASWRATGYPVHAYTKINLEKNCGVLSTMMQAGCQVVDVRTKVEFKENAVKSAVNLPLDGLLSSMDKLDKNLPVVCYCKGGFRSTIATSLLLKNGYVCQDVVKGFAAISTYCPLCTTTGKVCPSMKEIIDAQS